jgi:hypothetical protein
MSVSGMPSASIHRKPAMNPTLPIILVIVACVAVSAAAIFAANLYRRREAEATARRAAARQAERHAASEAKARELATAYQLSWIDPTTGKPHRNDHICNQQCRDLRDAARNIRAQAAPVRPPARDLARAARSRYDARPVQQPEVHGDSSTDLVNLLLMQQALNSVGHDHHEGYREERPEERYDSQDQPQEPAAYEAPAESEPVSYSAPEPVYTEPEPISYTAPEPAPSFDAPSFDSGSFGGGDSGSF